MLQLLFLKGNVIFFLFYIQVDGFKLVSTDSLYKCASYNFLYNLVTARTKKERIPMKNTNIKKYVLYTLCEVVASHTDPNI